MASGSRSLLLYSAPTSPYSLRVRTALEEAHVKHDFVSIILEEKPAGFVENINPAGIVPTLVYGDVETLPFGKPLPGSVVLTESLVILEFLADLFPDSGLLPKDPVKRAKARYFISVLNAKIHAEMRVWLMNKNNGTSYLKVLETLQALLPPDGYAVGEWSIADAAFFPFLLTAEVAIKTQVGFFVKVGDGDHVKTELASPRFVRLKKYFDENFARPSTKATWDEISFVNGIIRSGST